MRKYYFTMFAMAAILLLSACNSNNDTAKKEENKENGKVKVFTTIYPLTFFAEAIGKEHVSVESILPPGVDEHTYEPTSKTMIDIAEGDLFLYNGLNLEPFGDKLKDTLEPEDVKIVDVGSKLDLKDQEHGEHHDHEQGDENHDGHDHGGVDPHVWIEPALASQMAGVIRDELTELAPDKKKIFEENYQKLKVDLDKLDNKFQEIGDTAEQKKFLVSHGAFGYWEGYGLEQISISGLSPTNEPSQKQLKEMIEVAKKNNIRYVLFEQNVTPKVAKVVQNELKASPLQIHNLSVLTEEDMKSDEDYLSLMEKNINALRKATTK